MVYVDKDKNITLPQWILFFIKRIDERLKLKEWTPEYARTTRVCITASSMPYSFEGINAISRHYTTDKWKMTLSKFSTTNYGKSNQRYYYMWDLQKLS